MDLINRVLLTYLANALWMVCIITAMATLLSRLLRRAPSAYRHVLWVGSLFLASLLPLTSLWRFDTDPSGPVWPIRMARQSSSLSDGSKSTSAESFWIKMRHHRHPIPLAPALTAILSACYVAFGAYRGARLWWAWRQTTRMRRAASCCPVPSNLSAIWDRCSKDLSLGPVAVLCSSEATGPVTLGIRHSVLILPDRFFMHVSQEEFSSVLCHEFAHIRRHDFLVNLICELFLLPVSFHPAAAFIKARIDHSRELACDEIAAEKLSTRTRYARSLVSLAKSIRSASSSAQSSYGLGLFDTNTLEERIMNLLENSNAIGRRRGQSLVAFVSTLLLVTCLGISAFSFQLAQTDSAKDFRPFVGTWLAKFKDKKFQTLKLLIKDNQLTGTCSHTSIEMNSNGELTSAEQKEGDDPISSARVVGKVVHLTVGVNGHVETAQEGDDEPVEFEMKLTGTDQAELRILGAPPNMPAPKPWKLERTHESQ